MSVGNEILVMWAAVSLYAVAAILFIVGFIFKLPKVTRSATFVTLAAIAVHLVAIAGRWVRLGHGPYLGFYEVISSYALLGAVVFSLLIWRYKNLRSIGAVVLPITFLVIGGAMLAPKSELAVTSRLASYWLAVHVLFAKLSYGSFITSFAVAVMLLTREHRPGSVWAQRFAKLPSQEVLDDLVFKFVAAGFIFLGIMIAAGAIWANEAWGRYWGWDPIETWSLISWLCYAVVLHLRLTMGWKGKRFAWAAVAALPVNLFAVVGVAIVYNSIHGAYLTGY